MLASDVGRVGLSISAPIHRLAHLFVNPLPLLPRWMIVLGAILATVSAPLVGNVRAGDEAASQVWGKWHFVKERSDSIGVAADTAAKDLPFVIRPIGRARLYAALKPYQWVQLSRTGDQIQIVTNDWPVISTDCGGSKVPWKRPDGKKQQVSTSLTGDVLTQTFSSSEGSYTNEYSLDPGGFLQVRVTVMSPLMKAPVTYILRYRHQS